MDIPQAESGSEIFVWFYARLCRNKDEDLQILLVLVRFDKTLKYWKSPARRKPVGRRLFVKFSQRSSTTTLINALELEFHLFSSHKRHSV